MAQLTSARFQAALSDRYVFDRVLGRGGMGTVYLARDVKHGRQVAIKALSPDLAAEVDGRQFLREIRVTAQLQHPHILPLIDSGEAADCAFYVMPYVKGGSLRDLLEKKKRLSVDDALTIVSDIGEALACAHEDGVVHCDIKPENILISAGHAVLADFGIARVQRADGRTWRAVVDSSAGTPTYMSPEQATGERSLDARSDLYSLACVLYEMLSGEPPFSGDSDQAVIADRFAKPVPRLTEVVKHLPAGLSFAVAKAMAIDPDDRFFSVGRFLRAVESASVTSAGSMRRARRWSEALGILTYRLGSRIRRRVRSSWAASKQGLDRAAAKTSGRVRLQENTLG